MTRRSSAPAPSIGIPRSEYPLARREQITSVTSETPRKIVCDCSALLGIVYVWRPVQGCAGWWANVERRFVDPGWEFNAKRAKAVL